jgi:IS30 family transposase
VDWPAGPGHRVSIAERMEIMRGRDAGLSFAEIGVRIGRDRTVVWREYRRNCLPDGDYHALMAQAFATQKARRPKAFKLRNHPLCRSIEDWMDDGWSPKLVADVLARDYPDDKLMQVSHETIYQCLYVQTRGSLRADLHKCLSTKRSARKPRGVAGRTGVYGAEVFTISDRPPEAADRAVPGHWEGDLILGSTASGSAIGTLVERTTRFVMLLHLPDDHTALAVQEAIVAKMAQLPAILRQTLTWDQGKEMANHAAIAKATELAIYFCDPHSPWQRGTNENTNGLLRQYFAKGTDLSVFPADYLDYVATKLNRRPRQTLGWKNPAEALDELLSNPSKPPAVAKTA